MRNIIFLFLIGILFSACVNLNEETILNQTFDKAGRLISEKVEGYDCCEGFYIKTTIYDTLGNSIEIFGNTDGSRDKQVYQYENGELVFDGYYLIYQDTLDHNFDISNDSIDYLYEIEYYSNGKLKKSKHLDFFDRLSNRDTSSLVTKEYDNLGNIIVHTKFLKERNYLEENPLPQLSRYTKHTIFKDKIQGSIDTLHIEEELGLFNPRGL